MMVICILQSERPGDEFAYFMRPFCRKEMNWSLANEAATAGMWTKIQPVVDVQDSRTSQLSSDLTDEHLKGGEDPASSMSREDVHKIVKRDYIQYNTTDAAYMTVGHTKIIRELEAMAGDRMTEAEVQANAEADEEAERDAAEGTLLSTELVGETTHHVLLSFAPEGAAIAEKLSITLAERGYEVCSLPVSTDCDASQAAIDAAVAVMPIIGDKYLNGRASQVLQWAHEKQKVVQPLVHVKDKRNISNWIPRAPPYLRNKDWVDLHPGDADYWACGVNKLLAAMRDEADRPPAQRHEGSGVSPVAAAQRPPSSKDRRSGLRMPWTARRSKPSPSSGPAAAAAAAVHPTEAAASSSGAAPATQQPSKKAAGKRPAKQLSQPSLLPRPSGAAAGASAAAAVAEASSSAPAAVAATSTAAAAAALVAACSEDDDSRSASEKIRSSLVVSMGDGAGASSEGGGASAGGEAGHAVHDEIAEAELEFSEITQVVDHGSKEHPGREARRGSLLRLNAAARAALATGSLSMRRSSAAAEGGSVDSAENLVPTAAPSDAAAEQPPSPPQQDPDQAIVQRV